MTSGGHRVLLAWESSMFGRKATPVAPRSPARSIRVLCPASERPAKKTAPDELPAEDWSGDGATILVVDDEESVRMLTTAMLEMLDCRVLTAADGREAVEVFRQHDDEIDLVLLDQKMPIMSGDQAFREIRRIRSDARVIICSGLDEYELAKRFVGEDPDEFLRKPYELANLREKLRDVLAMEKNRARGRRPCVARDRGEEKDSNPRSDAQAA